MTFLKKIFDNQILEEYPDNVKVLSMNPITDQFVLKRLKEI